MPARILNTRYPPTSASDYSLLISIDIKYFYKKNIKKVNEN